MVLKIYLIIFLIHLFFSLLDHFCDTINISDTLRKKTDGDRVWFKFMTALFIAPVLEEIFFRLPIKKHKLYVISPIILIIAAIIAFWQSKYAPVLWFVPLGIYWIVIGYLHKKKFPKNIVLLNIFISSIIFGILHATNHKIELLDYNVNGALYFVKATLPLIIAGIGFGWIRVKYQIGWSMFTHFCYNLIPASLLFV